MLYRSVSEAYKRIYDGQLGAGVRPNLFEVGRLIFLSIVIKQHGRGSKTTIPHDTI